MIVTAVIIASMIAARVVCAVIVISVNIMVFMAAIIIRMSSATSGRNIRRNAHKM